MYSHWRTLCAKNRYWRSKTACVTNKSRGANLGDISHSSYDGGTLTIPVGAALEEFYDAVARDVAADAKAPFYITEVHTPVFPLYFDVDLKSYDAATRSAVIAGLKTHLAPLVAKFYPEARARQFDAIWCVPEAAEEFTGAHIYMWKVLVTTENARIICHALLMHMRAKYPTLFPNGEVWGDVIDIGVYALGLRMPGALLLKECPHCKAVKGDRIDPHCPYACRRGRICVGRRYVFHALVEGDGQTSASLDDFRHMLAGNWACLLKHTTLRTDRAATPGFTIYRGCPLPSDKGPRKTSADTLPDDHAAMPHLLTLIRSVKPCYQSVVIERVSRLSGGALFRVFVGGDNSKWCENKNDYHRNSRVQFEVRVSGVRIKCGCMKADTTGRRFGPCNKYVTAWVPLTDDVRHTLFPNRGAALAFKGAKRKRSVAEHNFMAQCSNLSFGRYLNGSREPSTSSSSSASRQHSRSSSVVASPRMSRPANLDDVSRRLTS